MAELWMRISQMQPFIGRCFETGDVTGAATIAFGLVRDLMRIGLVQARRYAPYAKWLGTAFARTQIGESISSWLDAATKGVADLTSLERAINGAGGELIMQLNGLELIAEVERMPQRFRSRPFMVLPAEEIALALKESVHGSSLERFATILGGIDAMTDSTDALVSPRYRLGIRDMFEWELASPEATQA